MPEFSLTDDVGKPVAGVTVDWTSASALFKYLKSEVLHLIVVPDFLARKDLPLAQAARDPIEFQLKAANKFQLGNVKPEIDIKPGVQIKLRANTMAGPANTGYAGLALTGSLGLGVSGSAGDLTFGLGESSSITIEYLKAFTMDDRGPTLGEAVGRMISSYVIPRDIADLRRLQANDVCTVSGKGSLKVSGGFTIATPVNPLASVNLPLGVGSVSVQDGVMAGVSASLTLSGSYQIRARKLSTGAVELSYMKEKGATLKTDLTASAGVSVKFGSTDLLAALLGAISTEEVDQNLLAGLTADEIKTFTGAIKDGIDHSLQAAVDLALSTSADDEATFQYEIQPDLLDATAAEAVNRALRGDLSSLTALEPGMQANGALAPGVKLTSTIFEQVRTKGVSLQVNLLGIVNLISLSKLISKCEILTEPISGDITIKETAESDRISAITGPFDRQEALRKAVFDSVMATTTYRVSKTVSMPELNCHNMHFAVNQNTNAQTVRDYLNWFVALNLMKAAEKPGILGQFGAGGASTCLMRTELDDRACESLFFDAAGNLRPEADYIEIGRRALQALLDPANDEIDRFRNQFLEDPTWQRARAIGPSPELRELLPLASGDARREVLLADVTGDLYDITWWAAAMTRAGKGLLEMRAFLAGRDPVSLAQDQEFAARRDKLQKLIAGVVKESRMRFHEPWGLVCLYWAAGSRQSAGKLVAGKWIIDRQSVASFAAS